MANLGGLRKERLNLLGEPSEAVLIGLVAGAVLSFVLAFVGPGLTAGALVGGAVLAGCFLSLEFGLAVLVSLVVLLRREELFAASIPAMGGGLKVTDVILVAILLGWAVRELLNRRAGDRPRTPALLVLFFVLIALVSAVVAIGSGTFYKDSLLELRPLLHLLLVIPIGREAGELNLGRLTRVILGACTLSALRALYLFSVGVGESASYTLGGTRVMAVGFAYLLVGALLGLVLSFRSPRRWIPALAALVCFGGLLVTFYRASYIGVAAAGLALWILALPHLRVRLVGIGAAALLLVVLGGVFEAVRGTGGIIGDTGRRMASLSSYESDPSAIHRLREWDAVLGMVRERPITGHGLGARIGFQSPMYNSELNHEGYWSQDIYMHNSYLWVATKLGLVALAAFLWLILGTFRRGYGPARASIHTGSGEVGALYLSLAALVVLAVFGPMLTTDNMTPFFAFTVGVLWASPAVVADAV